MTKIKYQKFLKNILVILSLISLNLTYLDCSNTNVSVISNLINLTYLDCSNTNVSVIPLLTNLTELRCYNTKVSVVPKELTKLTTTFQ